MVAVADADDPVNNSILAKMAASGGDWSTFVPATDALQAIRDHVGDGTNLTEAGGDGDHLTEAGGDGDHLLEAGGTGDQFSAIPWNGAWDAEVESEVNDALDTAISELGGDPGATPTLRTAMMLPYMAIRNKADTTAGAYEVHNSAGAVILTATLSDDAVTFSSSKLA